MLVAIEGVDGAGKSDLARWLLRWLSGSCGLRSALTREPWRAPHPPRGAPLADRLRTVCADRLEHAERVLQPLLTRGYAVVADRYHASLAVYEGANGEGEDDDVDPSSLYRAIRWGELQHTPVPDLWLWLRVPAPLAERRTGVLRFEHVAARSPASLARLDERYAALMPALGAVELDGTLHPERVRAGAAAAVVRLLPGCRSLQVSR